jgi:hypothetical protein
LIIILIAEKCAKSQHLRTLGVGGLVHWPSKDHTFTCYMSPHFFSKLIIKFVHTTIDSWNFAKVGIKQQSINLNLNFQFQVLEALCQQEKQWNTIPHLVMILWHRMDRHRTLILDISVSLLCGNIKVKV